MTKNATKEKVEDVRYNLRLPASVYDELGHFSEKKGTSRLELIKKFIQLGFIVLNLEEEENSGLYLKRDGEFERILIL